MTSKPVIFISSTSDLRSARDLVGKVLFSMGYEPVWQDIEAVDGGELLEVLRRRIEPCAMVLQLVGQRYGAEPPRPTPEFGRVSYTQFEAREAERVGKKVIYLFLDEGYPVDPAAPEFEELMALQEAYQQWIKDANRLRYKVASLIELENCIYRIRDELNSARRESENRFGELLGFARAGASRIDELKAIVAVLSRQMADVLDNKYVTTDQTQPTPLAPDIIAKAKILIEFGDAAQRALGMIADRQSAEADRIIQELKSKPGNPIDDAFRLLTMEGDNWYQANQPDKAIGPYEQAMALKPDEFTARNNATIAHIVARLGSVAEHLQRAIEIAEGTLRIIPPRSQEWARTQHNLGAAWSEVPTGIPSENLEKAIAAYEAALTVRTKHDFPSLWAMTQNNLATVWMELPMDDQGENLNRAIAAYEAVLTVHTKEAFPFEWGKTQNNLGIAWSIHPTGDWGENRKKATDAFEDALTVYPKDNFPSDWGTTQHNLGAVWSKVRTGILSENLKKAIAAYEAALTVRTRDAFPSGWAKTQNNLGVARASLSRCQIMAKDFNEALATTEAEPNVSLHHLDLERSRAHTLLFLNRTEEAMAIYLKHIGEKMGDETWEQVILFGFKELEKQGLTHPQFQSIRDLIKSGKQ